MTDAPALSTAAADPAAAPLLTVSADVVLLTLDERTLRVVLVPRSSPPARAKLALPGVLVGADEDLDRAARRALREGVGLDPPVRQFHAFGAVDRDPQARVVSVAYLALLPLRELRPVVGERVRLAELRDGVVRTDTGRALALPLDHAEIVAAALEDLRAHLDTTSWSFGLLGTEFTLRELQAVHEAIRGRVVNKPAFRKRMLDSGKLAPTGRLETDTRFRPAELYRLREEFARD